MDRLPAELPGIPRRRRLRRGLVRLPAPEPSAVPQRRAPSQAHVQERSTESHVVRCATVTPAGCVMDRLPAELLVDVVSLLKSPIDACRAAAVSGAFRAAADSDAVWARFLPRNLPQFAKGELPRKPMSKKELFRRLSGQPALFPHKIIGMDTCAERITLSLGALQIPDGPYSYIARVDSPSNYSRRDPRCRLFFSYAAQFFPDHRLEFRAKIKRKILSDNTTYWVYMVFKPPPPCYHWRKFPTLEASIGLAGMESTRKVCMRDDVKGENLHFPRKKADGWMEVELGEFRNMQGDSGDDVLIRLAETTPRCTYGLEVWVLELRSSPSVLD